MSTTKSVGTLYAKNIRVDESIDVSTITSGSSIVNGSQTITGGLGVGGKASISGSADVAGEMSVGGDLRVGGALVVDGGETISGQNFVNLNLSGDTTLDSGHTFIGKIVVDGDIEFTGSISGDSGFTPYDDLSVGNLEVSGNMVVDGDISGSTLRDSSLVGVTNLNGHVFNDNLLLSGNLFAESSVSPGHLLYGDVTISGNLFVENGTISGNISGDSGFTSYDDLSVGTLEISNRIIFSGESDKAPISIGLNAGSGVGPSNESIAIGNGSGGNAGAGSIAIGYDAGQNGLADYSIAIGNFASTMSQTESSIVINATGEDLDPSDETGTGISGLFIKPIRQADTSGLPIGALWYDTSTGEIRSQQTDQPLFVPYDDLSVGNLEVSGDLEVGGTVFAPVLFDGALEGTTELDVDHQFNGDLLLSGNLIVTNGTISGTIPGDSGFTPYDDLSVGTLEVSGRILTETGTETVNPILIGNENTGSVSGGQSGRIVIGYDAGTTISGSSEGSVAIGFNAGNANQSSDAIAIGNIAGTTSQGNQSIAIGNEAANLQQGNQAIAIGSGAGTATQGDNAIAIGTQAGGGAQGVNSIAIGNQAGVNGMSDNTIVINATGSQLDGTISGAFYVSPIRDVSTGVPGFTKILVYNPSTGEIGLSG